MFSDPLWGLYLINAIHVTLFVRAQKEEAKKEDQTYLYFTPAIQMLAGDGLPAGEDQLYLPDCQINKTWPYQRSLPTFAYNRPIRRSSQGWS